MADKRIAQGSLLFAGVTPAFRLKMPESHNNHVIYQCRCCLHRRTEDYDEENVMHSR
jgi:hypothetical protein